MTTETITLSVQEYRCEPCSLKQGTAVRELVRMIPRSVIMNGELVGDEFYCCPICFEAKFPVKKRKVSKDAQIALAKDTNGRRSAKPVSGRIRLVKS